MKTLQSWFVMSSGLTRRVGGVRVLAGLFGYGLGLLTTGFGCLQAQEPIGVADLPVAEELAVPEANGGPEPLDLVRDGMFSAPEYAQTTLVRTQKKIGDWQVDLGDVDVHVGEYRPDGYQGKVIDLNGTRSGSIYQTVTVQPGLRYTVKFLAAGKWGAGDSRPRVITVRLGKQRMTFSIARPADWSRSVPGWKWYTADLLASGTQSALRFTSETSRTADGPMIAAVSLYAPKGPPGPLSSIPVPLPADLDRYIASRERAIALGKALFWDMQVGSDGRTACATCHWHAGADQRLKNSLHPGAPGSNFGPQYPQSASLFTAAVGQFRGVNKTLKADDFPFHKVLQPLAPADRQGQPSKGNPVLRDTREIAGSQGVLTEDFIALARGKSADIGKPVLNPVFSMHGVNVRQVTGRNSPTTINAVYFDRLFWDGRASRYFNGVNPFGDLDPDAGVYCAEADGSMQKVSIRIDNAALASQATGPAISPVEMSWDGRRFSELARKLLPLRPLALQKVAPDDSVLGCFCDASGHGLCSKKTSYSQLIREAFKPEWWSGRRLTPEGFTHMEANFSLYWGLAIMMYESTLVSDQAPYDRWAAGDRAALSPLAKEGLKLFMNEGRCINCHSGPEFAGATVSELRGVLSNDGVVEKMQMSAGIAVYDGGFYNIGVRPTFEDIAVGAAHPLFGPLSYSRQEQLGRDPEPKLVVAKDQRLAVNGAFKTPTLRNVSLTGPYMHNGGMKSLREVVEFYVRGGDFPDQNRQDLAPDIRPIEGMYGNEFKVDALVEFLEHLTDERVRQQKAPFDHPELVIPNGHAAECYDEAMDQLLVIPANGREGGESLWTFEQTLERGMQWRGGSGEYPDKKYVPGPVNDIPPAELIPGDYRPLPPASAPKYPAAGALKQPAFWQE